MKLLLSPNNIFVQEVNNYRLNQSRKGDCVSNTKSAISGIKSEYFLNYFKFSALEKKLQLSKSGQLT